MLQHGHAELNRRFAWLGERHVNAAAIKLDEHRPATIPREAGAIVMYVVSDYLQSNAPPSWLLPSSEFKAIRLAELPSAVQPQ